MLVLRAMKWLWMAACLVGATASTASAGPYVGLGIGSSARTSSDSTTMSGDGRSGRLMLGWRFGRLSAEATGTRYDLWVASAPFTATQLALGGKYSLPLGDNFEAFGRGGLQRTSLSQQSSGGYDASGGGWYLGAGFEYRIKAILAGASVFVDYQYASTNFDNGMGEYRGGAGLWTLGATVSF